MKCQIFIDILLLIGVVYLFICCNNNDKDYTTNAPYEINYYTDTINGHVVLTTVCSVNDGYNSKISCSTIELKD